MQRALWLLLIVVLWGGAPLEAQENCGLPPRLVIGQQGRVLPGDANNVRAEPSRSAALVGQLPGGAAFTVLDGPICADGLSWWQVSYENLIGWTVEGTVEYFVEPIAPLPTADATAQPTLTENAITRASVSRLEARRIDFTDVSALDVSGRWLVVWENDGIWLKDRTSTEGAVLAQRVSRGYGYNLSISPDDRWVAYTHNQAVNLMDPLSREVVYTFPISWSRVALEFSPDGQRLVVESWNELTIIHLADGSTTTFPIEDGGHSVAFSPDGAYLASSRSEQPIVLLDTQSWTVVQTLSTEGYHLRFTPDGQHLLFNHEGDLFLWDWQRDQAVGMLENRSDYALSPDGSLLLTQTQPGNLMERLAVLDGQTWEELVSLPLEGIVDSVHFSPDAGQLYTITDGELLEWTVGTGSLNPAETIANQCPGFLASRLVPDQRARVAPNASAVFLREEPHPESGVLQTLSPRTEFVVLEGPQCTLGTAWWRVDINGVTGWTNEGQANRYAIQPLLPLVTPQFNGDPQTLLGSGDILHVRVSPDGEQIAVVSTTGVWLYTTDDWTAPPLLLYHDQDRITETAFHPDGIRLATASGQQVRIWDTRTGQVVDQPERRSHTQAVAFSPDGTALAYSDYSEDRTLVWDLNERYISAESPTDVFGQEMFFSADSRRLYVVWTSENMSVAIWRIGSSDEPVVVSGNRYSSARNPILSPDGLTLATLGDGIMLWNAETGVEQGRLYSPSPADRYLSGFSGLAYASDGTRLASVGERLLLWDVTASSPVLLRGNFDIGYSANHVRYNADGTRLLTSSSGSPFQTTVWSIAGDTATLLFTVEGNRAEFLPDGRVITMMTNAVLVYSPDGERIAQLEG